MTTGSLFLRAINFFTSPVSPSNRMCGITLDCQHPSPPFQLLVQLIIQRNLDLFLVPTNELQFLSWRFCVKFADTLASCSSKVMFPRLCFFFSCVYISMRVHGCVQAQSHLIQWQFYSWLLSDNAKTEHSNEDEL